MDREIVWTERASADVEAIVRYIARRDPSAASRIGLGIFQRVQILLQHPEAGSERIGGIAWRRLAQIHFSAVENRLYHPRRKNHRGSCLACGNGRG